MMNELISEAIEISSELPKVIVVGAVAVMLHTKRNRASNDVDIGMAGTISRDEMIALRYHPIEKTDSWYSPRGIKIDVYREDVSGIPVSQLEKTAIKFNLGKNKIICAACVEALIIMKYRAYSDRDTPNYQDDLELLIHKKSKTIDWEILKKLCYNLMEFELIKQIILQYQQF